MCVPLPCAIQSCAKIRGQGWILLVLRLMRCDAFPYVHSYTVRGAAAFLHHANGVGLSPLYLRVYPAAVYNVLTRTIYWRHSCGAAACVQNAVGNVGTISW